MTSFRFCDETDFGFGWIAEERMRRCSHALAADGKVWFVDPLAWDEAEKRARTLGEPAGVLQLLDRHNRDCAEVARRLGVPHLRLDVPPPFEAVSVVRIPRWHEIALWWPERKVLVVADALAGFGYWTAPGERLGLNPLMRLFPPRQLGRCRPEHILSGHGEGVHERAALALADALRAPRRRLLRAIL